MVLDIIRESLSSIVNPRFYNTERGFQGELIAELRQRLPRLDVYDVIVEQEYQKRIADHGIRIRPDIIIHTPYEQSNYDSRRDGNLVVIELKLSSSQEDAIADYRNLSRMCTVLNYPLAVFININSDRTFLENFENDEKANIHAFSSRLINGQVELVEDAT